MDNLQIKKKQEKEEVTLAIFFPKFTKKHPRNECPLNILEVFAICEDTHAYNKCLTLPGLKAAYQWVEENVEPLCFINQIRKVFPRTF